jgi:acetylornithine deacetylase/succinyl-diaminopimelate desuccinylase-like protein
VIASEVVEYVRSAASSERYSEYLQQLLTELVSINTAPSADLADTAVRERAFFDRVEQEIHSLTGGEAVCERPAINAAIAADPAYSPPAYAANAQGCVPPADQVYAGRTNFVALIPGQGGAREPAAILHAHADTVSPWFRPWTDGPRVIGRGACDNKSQIAILLALLKLLGEVGERTGRRPARGFVLQLTLDEEIGGNGSIAMAGDGRFAGLPVLMLDATDLVPYCAHRGAVYYRCRMSASSHPRTTALEVFPFVILELEAEGRRLKQETNCPLFTADHVQTNHGVLGPFGQHPGSVCDHAAFEVSFESAAHARQIQHQITESLAETMDEYISRYGDKQREKDPATGRPKVVRHFDMHIRDLPDSRSFRLDVWGKGGHMAAVGACDNAITKAAYLLAGVLRVFSAFPDARIGLRLANAHNGVSHGQIVLEGGQGFTPTHTMAEVQARLARAARRGAINYCRVRQVPFEESMIRMTFDRLHNDAYIDSPDSAPMQALRAAFEALGQPWPAPAAWQTSCDARIYHHRGHPVAIFGAGKLETCHSDYEYVDIPDVQMALAIVTLASWALTG